MIVRVTRGDLVESEHEIGACVADARGVVVFATGDVERPVYLRSAAKPFIAAAIVASGAAERFAFTDRELAVVAASHNGEPAHVDAVLGILAKIGATPADLRCGAHAPAYEPAAAALAARGELPSATHNNCSGKHAGILALCTHLHVDPATYPEAAHPAQGLILELCARLAGVPVEALPLGIDGCGIPVYATSLRRAAQSFARFATLEEVEEGDARALARVRAAMAAQPFYVAGSGRFDTALGEATHGRVVGKAGAEGVHGDAMPREGLGLAVKVADGARRAAAPATIALLERIGSLDPGERSALEEHARPHVFNVAGVSVGDIVASV